MNVLVTTHYHVIEKRSRTETRWIFPQHYSGPCTWWHHLVPCIHTHRLFTRSYTAN